MSWFTLQDQPIRKKRVGIWIRLRSPTTGDVDRAIEKSGLKRLTEVVEWVEIKELRPNSQVLLEVWCISLKDCAFKKHRHNVFHLIVDENPEWVCEGDLGRGLKSK